MKKREGENEGLTEIHKKSQFQISFRNFSILCLFFSNRFRTLVMSLPFKEFKEKYKIRLVTCNDRTKVTEIAFDYLYITTVLLLLILN